MQIYEERLQRVSTTGDNSLQNLRTEFAVTLLRYSLHCLNATFESMVVFKVSSTLKFTHKREADEYKQELCFLFFELFTTYI